MSYQYYYTVKHLCSGQSWEIKKCPLLRKPLYTSNYFHHTSRCVKCRGEHSSDIYCKDKSSPSKCAPCMGDHTSSNKRYPKYKALLKRRIETHSNRQISNTALTTLILKSPPHLLKVSYAFVVNSNNILLSNSSIYDKSFSKFISELSTSINPLIFSLHPYCTNNIFHSPNYIYLINLITTMAYSLITIPVHSNK